MILFRALSARSPSVHARSGRRRNVAQLSARVGALALALLASVLVALASPTASEARSRIKDLVSFEGVRGNDLLGYGLVVGLNGTGDTLRNAPFTQQSIQDALERLGTQTHNATNIDTKDIAAVIITAKLPPFAAPGSKFDVQVSAIGDAKSLLGGRLIATALLGADGAVHAVAAGTVQTGAVSAGGASGSSVTRGVPTSGGIADGATVEQESNDVGFSLDKMESLRLTLHNPDFTTARRIADVINAAFPGSAEDENGTVVKVKPPSDMKMVAFLDAVEQLYVEPDLPARVIINEADGVVVINGDVRISTVAIAQGNITIAVSETPKVSQPAPFSNGQTTVTPQTAIKVDEEKGRKLITMNAGASLTALVSGLNMLKVTPHDMITILQAIKADGALQAEIQVM
jgi:flagellar P-ring protein precursor FlgI